MAYAFAQRWEKAGHRVVYHRGLAPPPPGDVAIAHCDLTIVPESYRELERRYPRVVNGAAWDVSKSRVSNCIVGRGDPWQEQVIIKTEANHGGHVEDALRRLAREAGLASDFAALPVMDDYYLCESLARVPEAIWGTPGVVVEKFVPERDERGYYTRVWTFFGERDRSSRYRSDMPLIKAENYLDREEVAVPGELREMRSRLGFDFGKFDYTMRDGRCWLFDANRTPTSPEHFISRPGVSESFDNLARGIESFL